MPGPIRFHDYDLEGIAMYFSLLVSHLPHATDAHGHYPDVLAQPARLHRARQAAARWLAAVAARLRFIG